MYNNYNICLSRVIRIVPHWGAYSVPPDPLLVQRWLAASTLPKNLTPFSVFPASGFGPSGLVSRPLQISDWKDAFVRRGQGRGGRAAARSRWWWRWLGRGDAPVATPPSAVRRRAPRRRRPLAGRRPPPTTRPERRRPGARRAGGTGCRRDRARRGPRSSPGRLRTVEARGASPRGAEGERTRPLGTASTSRWPPSTPTVQSSQFKLSAEFGHRCQRKKDASASLAYM